MLLAVALGVVAAPHLLGRHVSQSAVAPGGAVKRTAAALVAVAHLIASLPPLAVYSRIGFEQAMSKGIETAAIPQSFAEASALGWVKVCDQNSGTRRPISPPPAPKSRDNAAFSGFRILPSRPTALSSLRRRYLGS